MFVNISLKFAADEAIERLKFDIFQDEVAIAFFDMRGLPSEFNAQEALQCYRQQGLKALKNLCAGYACIICDSRCQRVIFSSDSLGHTTFFYHVDSNKILISDVLRNICSRISAPIDRQSFDWYFKCGFVPGNRTIYENIYKLSAGEYLVVEKGHVSLKAYDRLPRVVHAQENKLKLNLNKGLRSIVKRTLRRPTGIMFSGGFDSSLLCRLVQFYQKNVKTYAIGCQGHNQETLDHCMYIARVLGAKHKIIDVTLKEYLAALPLTVRLMDEPILDLDTAVIYPALRKIPQRIKFLLHGFGSDQLIGNDFLHLKDLAESMRVFSDFDRYSSMNGDNRAAGLFFIREKMPQEVRLHYRLSPGSRGRLIFPFFEQSIVQLALQMPDELRLNKKLLRSLIPSLTKILAFNQSKRSVQGVKGQISETVKHITRQVYGRNLIQSRLLQNLMGKSRLCSVLSSGKNEDILKLVVFNLWVREVAGKQEAINHD